MHLNLHKLHKHFHGIFGSVGVGLHTHLFIFDFVLDVNCLFVRLMATMLDLLDWLLGFLDGCQKLLVAFRKLRDLPPVHLHLPDINYELQ